MMNNRGHLPAGQPMQGGVADMGPSPGGGRRGGRPQHYPNNAHHYHQPIYPPGYITPYGAAAPYYMPPHYQNGGMAAPAYLPYPPAGYNRSPPSMQHYVPMVPQVPVPQSHFSRPSQSPIIPAPYQVPPPVLQQHIPVPPHTPSSTHSHGGPPITPTSSIIPEPAQVQAEPQSEPQAGPKSEPQVMYQQPPQPDAGSQVREPQEPPQKPPAPAAEPPSPVLPTRIEPYRPPLPWYSVPDSPFPSRAPRSRRRRRALGAGVEMERPDAQQTPTATNAAHDAPTPIPVEQAETEPSVTTTPKVLSKASTYEARSETPSTQDHPFEDAPSTSPTTPSSVQASQSGTSASITVASKSVKSATRSAVPAVPALPLIQALPKISPKETKLVDKTQAGVKAVGDNAVDEQAEPQETPSKAINGTAEEPSPEAAQPSAPVAPAKPKSWANLFTKPSLSTSSAAVTAATSQSQTNGNVAADDSSAAPGTVSGFARSNSSSIAEALQAYRVGGAEKLAFLEPRGLVNTGNMCYMNSVLQVLIFCVPFFDFLDQVSKKAAYSFKSDTPLLDAIIMFMREFKVIDSAVSVEQLRRRLKSEELEQYGEAFTPEFVYDAIRKLPRFASMRRGHQQDAEEFLGFLLEGLHDECAQVMRAAPPSTASTAPNSSLSSPTTSSRPQDTADGEDWLEVGPRQRAAVTRSSGYSTVSSPVTKIFGGQLRSELRVPGLKNSVTLEPYQPLQLDIGSPDIRNIVDALNGITRPETLNGDFNSPYGKDAKATKQVFIESLPPVLILHLKRFQFDAEGNGTVKIWKKIGYPLELEIPRDVLSRQKRNSILSEGAGLPRYRLTAVVYHHGKNASGGHYTVDVRRQDGREWIRIDDTVIRRVRSEDVAEGGAEDDSSKSGHIDSRKETSTPVGGNRFVGINDEDTGDDDGWKQATASNKKWSNVVNGVSPTPANGPKAKQHKDNIKDNKVAYLLFYQRI